MNKVYKIWKSGEHDKERYPIKYYTEWAKKKGIRPRWFDWAEKENLIAGEGKVIELDPRSEKTYLNIIGALLEYIRGESPGIDKHPNYSSQAQLIDLFVEYEIYGLKKTTLEAKFAAAKRSFESE